MLTIICGLQAPWLAVILIDAASVAQLHEQLQHILTHYAVLLAMLEGFLDDTQHSLAHRIGYSNAEQELGNAMNIKQGISTAR